MKLNKRTDYETTEIVYVKQVAVAK